MENTTDPETRESTLEPHTERERTLENKRERTLENKRETTLERERTLENNRERTLETYAQRQREETQVNIRIKQNKKEAPTEKRGDNGKGEGTRKHSEVDRKRHKGNTRERVKIINKKEYFHKKKNTHGTKEGTENTSITERKEKPQEKNNQEKEDNNSQNKNTKKRVHFPPETEISHTRYYQKERQTRCRRKKRRPMAELKIIYTNINGIAGKISSLETVMKSEESDIALITETKGHPPKMQGYEWFHRERMGKKGGGVAIAVKNDIARYTKRVTDIEDQDQEVIWIETNIPGNDKLYVGCYYGHQEKDQKEEIERQFSQLETQIHKMKKDGGIILGGDFNAKLEINKQNVRQKESRNGKIMNRMLKKTSMKPISTESETGMWTRVNRQRESEKAIIDYILACGKITQRTISCDVDEEGTLRMKGNVRESDHNTITTKIKISRQTKKYKIKRWKINNEEGWKNFNKKLQEDTKKGIPRTYEECTKLIKAAMRSTIGEETITITIPPPRKNSERMKHLIINKKEKRASFEKAKQEEKREKREEYYQAQRQCREQAEREEQEKTKAIIENLLTDRNPKNKIWELRKQYTRKERGEYDLISEEDNLITNPEEAKEYIAKYYEDLYQAREGKPEVEEWTRHIIEEVKRIENQGREKENEHPITQEEMISARKKSKAKKAAGPDEIPNEIFIKADKKTLLIYKEILNNTVHNLEIPRQWKEGEIISIYKGKGKKGKCSNERGITLSSNFGKFYERIINERIKGKMKASDHQGGGKKGANTADHILILKELQKVEKTTYITFLDVTKAYDKAWADALLYVINKRGVKNKLWLTVKNLNENLIARVRTKHGTTRDIRIKDSIRQGGVLSVTMYATMMDEIAEEIQNQNLGVKLDEETKVGCLLWMDDVALIANDQTEMQEMLNITGKIADRYHIEFGKAKSKVMKIGKGELTGTLKLGDMEIEKCEKYKYLGMTLNSDNNLRDHIEDIKGRAEAAYQVMLSITGSVDFKGIELEAIWQLLESCIIPIITYAAEANNYTKKEVKQLNSILDALLKRILMTPVSTPREVLYYETGLLDIEHTIIKNKMNYARKLTKKDNQLLKKAITSGKNKWMQNVTEYRNEMNLDENAGKEQIKRAIEIRMLEELKKSSETKSKIKNYSEKTQKTQVCNRKNYLKKGTRHTASNIFIARARMIETKNNYKNRYQNTTCRFCAREEETQTHVLEECQEIDREKYPKATTQEIFNENTDNLKDTAKRIHNIRTLLKETSAAPPANAEG